MPRFTRSGSVEVYYVPSNFPPPPLAQRLLTVAEVEARRVRRARLARLAMICAATIASLLLLGCAPPDQDVPVSGPSPTSAPAHGAVILSAGDPALWASAVTTTTTTTTSTTTTTTTAPPAPPPAPVVEIQTPPPPPPPPADLTTPCGGWGEIVAEHFGDQAAKACEVIGCETGYTWDPTIENRKGSTASGLLQFLDSTWVGDPAEGRAGARDYVPAAKQYARAAHAPGAVQIEVGAAWLRATSWSQWECA